MNSLFVLALLCILTISAATVSASTCTCSTTVKQGSGFAVRLNENPSTGYAWQMSTTSGLKITGDFFSPSSSVLGSAGVHVWIIKATSKGMQQIKAIYKRPRMPTTGNEQTYICNVKVV
jgi:inhibitor of cysteine peptidase